MKRWIIPIFIAMFCLISYIQASISIDFNGKPKMFHPKQIQGYFIWGDDSGVHLRVAAAGENHVFTGTISSDGKIEDLTEKSFNDADDFSHVKEQNHTINFQFSTSGEAVGVDFYVYQAKAMDFDFYLDGAIITSDQIFVGHEGWHPASNKFTLYYDQDPNDNTSENSVIIIAHPGWLWWGGPHWHHRYW